MASRCPGPTPRASSSSAAPGRGTRGRSYVQGKDKRGIDLASFEYLNPVYVKDATAVHDWKGRIKGADPTTFEVLDSGLHIQESVNTGGWARGYARDSLAVYYHDQMFGRATPLRGADPKTFVSPRNDYAYDSKGVWNQKCRLPQADPKTWSYLGRAWSMDATHIYYAEREVQGLDLAHFTVVNAPTIGNFATAGRRFLDADKDIGPEVCWTKFRENFGGFETWLRADIAAGPD